MSRHLPGRQRNIGDLTRWKEHDAYSKGLEQLLRDLEVEATPRPADRAHRRTAG